MAISPTSPGGDVVAVVVDQAHLARRAIGVPIEPGLRSACGWLNEATGEVSDSP